MLSQGRRWTKCSGFVGEIRAQGGVVQLYPWPAVEQWQGLGPREGVGLGGQKCLREPLCPQGSRSGPKRAGEGQEDQRVREISAGCGMHLWWCSRGYHPHQLVSGEKKKDTEPREQTQTCHQVEAVAESGILKYSIEKEQMSLLLPWPTPEFVVWDRFHHTCDLSFRKLKYSWKNMLPVNTFIPGRLHWGCRSWQSARHTPVRPLSPHLSSEEKAYACPRYHLLPQTRQGADGSPLIHKGQNHSRYLKQNNNKMIKLLEDYC